MEEIVIRSLQGIALPEELDRLARWRGEAPEHEQIYRDLETLWEATERPDDRALRSGPPSSFEIIRAARQREQRRSSPPEPGSSGMSG